MTPPTTEISTDEYDGANSYILAPGGQTVDIPLKRAFDIWDAYKENNPTTDPATGKVLDLGDINNLTGTLSANIVWQETNVLDATNALTITGGTTPATANLTVKSGSGEGNALVSVSLGDKVLWQWHIWVSSYDPTKNATPYIVNGRTDWYMDRSLGATATSGTAAYGLYYQWGRHVPIQRIGTVDLIDATNVEKDNLTMAIQSEKFMIYYTTETHDWYSSTPNQWDVRWGDLNSGETKKSPFDPCPRGWRLPSAADNKTPWECLDENSSGGGAGGWDFNETGRELGHFPTAGYRANGDGSLGDQGKAGYVWTASPNEKMAGALFYDGTTINTWDKYNRANAMNVRCLKEK